MQVTNNFKKKYIKKQTQKVRALIKLTCHWDSNSTSVYNDSRHLTSSLTEKEPHTAITNQPEDVMRKYSNRKEYKESSLE